MKFLFLLLACFTLQAQVSLKNPNLKEFRILNSPRGFFIVGEKGIGYYFYFEKLKFIGTNDIDYNNQEWQRIYYSNLIETKTNTLLVITNLFLPTNCFTIYPPPRFPLGGGIENTCFCISNYPTN